MVLEGASLVLGALFLTAGAGKLARPAGLRTTLLLADLVPARFVQATLVAVPILELCAGGLLVTGLLPPAGALLALGLLATFTVRAWPAVTARRSAGLIRCSCLGTADERLDAGLIGRNGLLICYAVASAVGASAPPYAAIAASPWTYGITIAGLALAPFVLAEAVSLWHAAARLPELPSLSGLTTEGTTSP